MALFALKTLVADRGKLLIALVGVVFSLVLVNIQGGLFLGMMRKASLLVDNCDADIWVGRRGLENVDLPYEIPEALLGRIRGLPAVRHVAPYIVAYGTMTFADGGYETVWLIGSEPSSMMGGPWAFHEGSIADLHRPYSVAVDQLDAWKLGFPQCGDIVEINGQRARVVAKTYGILGFLTTPYVFTTLDSARRFARMPEGYCSFFLVRAEPGTDIASLQAEIRQQLPTLDVYTAGELSRMSRVYFMRRTGIGMAFGGSTALGLLVGLVMVAQSLYALVLDHLADYATLKAIGAEDRHVYGVLLLQSLTIAAVGSVLGTGIAYVVRVVGSTPFAPIETSFGLQLAAAGLVVAICLLSSILPFHRLRGVDPAIVLQG